MGRVAAAGAILVALVALGAAPAAGAELSGVFQYLAKSECHFINGTEKMRFVEKHIYNREQFLMFDSDVGHFVGFTPNGEANARNLNSQPELPPGVSISLLPSSSQPGPRGLLCSVMDFYPAHIQVRWFQGQQELSGHVVATDVVPNGDWTYQLLVLLETPPRRGVTYTCQVEHVSLEQPLRRHWGAGEPLAGPAEALGCAGRNTEGAAESPMPPDAAHSKMLTGIGGFVLGLVFLAMGLGFYLCKKSS
ncbi:class II histocompatibility antigen, B-L beta chain-like [Sylvia borin]